jgi:diguanylate cyclase (GGDEF)-like protein
MGTGTLKKKPDPAINPTLPAGPGDAASEKPSSAGSGKPGRNLADILGKGKAAAFLLDCRRLKKKAFIALVENLSSKEREALDRLNPLVLDLEDDLLEKVMELQRDNAQLQSLALVDGLTGLYNNRFFTIQLEKEMARTRRTNLPCCLLMLDLDNFKAINDTLGHVEGNRFLASVAVHLREMVRSNDTVCRYGGDEFAVIMPATGLSEATPIAGRLIRAVKKQAAPLRLGVSLSVGAAEYTTITDWGLQEFVRAADSALYEAKRQGKNRLAVKGKPMPTPSETGMVSTEEKEALFAIKGHLERKGVENDG